MQHRTCSKCGESKPETEEFFRKRGHPCRGGLRPDCRECTQARDRAYYERNREKVMTYREVNAEIIKAKRPAREAKYMATKAGQQSRLAARKRYAQTEKGKAAFKLSQHRRRARLAGVLSDFTADEWFVILAKFGHVCAYCGAGGNLYQEHVVPIAKGGPNTRSNVVPACRSCNSRKFQSDMESWFRAQPNFTEARLAAILAHTALR